MQNIVRRKFAWFPRIVDTWRSSPSKALIWLQSYYERGDEKYCLYLGFFSYEF